MSEVLASLKKKGGGREYGVNLFCWQISGVFTTTSWDEAAIPTPINDPSATTPRVVLDSSFAYLSGGQLIVTKAIPKAYVSGIANSGRNTSGTAVYSGVRIKKNGTVINAASGSSGTPNPSFIRTETSFAVGDVISVETFRTASGSNVSGYLNIVTD